MLKAALHYPIDWQIKVFSIDTFIYWCLYQKAYADALIKFQVLRLIKPSLIVPENSCKYSYYVTISKTDKNENLNIIKKKYIFNYVR